MNKIIRISLLGVAFLILPACILFPSNPVEPENTSVVKLTVQTKDGVTTYNTVGQVINYNYVVTNTASSKLAGPVIVVDTGRQVSCPEVKTVGNMDDYLDLNETITCTAAYTITQADLTTGSLTNVATATVGGVISNQSGVTLTVGTAQPNVLTLTKAADLMTYGQVGQTITYSYTIKNSGATTLGPTQFIITDNRLVAPINCGPNATTLAANQSITCSAPYIITAADMTVPNLTNSATASVANGQTSAPASVTITNITIPNTLTPAPIITLTPSSPSNLTPGSTIQHQVAVGEWLIQIARCYGANSKDVIDANPQISDPDFILPAMIVTVPRIGSAGTIYGPPCITYHTVQSGDTWTSIAQRYNADLAVLQHVNPVSLTNGTILKIPLNSAGGISPPVNPTIAPTSTTTTSTRITIASGQTSASIVGVLKPQTTIRYVINVNQGQILTVKLSAPANEVTLAIYGPTGLALKSADTTLTWSGTITTGGDHIIDIAAILGSTDKGYTLDVSVTNS